MKYITRFTFLFFAICLFSACSEKAPPPPSFQEIEKIRIETEKKVQEANAQRLTAEQGKSNLQNIALGPL